MSYAGYRTQNETTLIKYSFCTYHETMSVQTVQLWERQTVNRTHVYELEAIDLCELDSSVTSGEICALLGYYAEFGGNSLPTFRDSLSVPS
jgi:hypothetical protein